METRAKRMLSVHLGAALNQFASAAVMTIARLVTSATQTDTHQIPSLAFQVISRLVKRVNIQINALHGAALMPYANAEEIRIAPKKKCAIDRSLRFHALSKRLRRLRQVSVMSLPHGPALIFHCVQVPRHQPVRHCAHQ